MSTQTPVTHLYEFGSFRLDTAERQLLRDGEAVRLTPKAYEMLVVLVERRGRIVEKDELLREVWPDAFVEEGNLTQHGAEREYERAIELDPNYAQAHRQYALVLLRLGRFDEALAGIKRAMELEPYSLQRHQNLGQVFYYARQYDQALEQGRILLELDPKDGQGFWLAYLHKGMYEEAIAELRKEVAGRSNPVSVHLGYAYAVAGKRDEAQEMLDKLNEQSKQRYVSAFSRALIYAGLGEKDQAFYWLEKSYQARERETSWIKVDPKMDNLRTDPRFADLLQRIGLSP